MILRIDRLQTERGEVERDHSLAIARGTLISRIVFLRLRSLSMIPPATPTAVAPTATERASAQSGYPAALSSNRYAGILRCSGFDRLRVAPFSKGTQSTTQGDSMAATPARDAKLVELLNEAYTKEKQLEVSLDAHIEMTTRDDYARRLKDHLKETKSHSSQVSKRIKQLGGTPETVSLPGPDGLTKAAERVSGALGKAKAAAQGPLHVVRGSGEQERMLHNARTEYQEEAWEIATYTVIDALATAAGDKPTAKLARDILRQEERMQQFLGTLLPELSADVAHDEIPVAEIDGPGSHRTAADSKPKSPSSRATKATSSSSRATRASTRKKTASGGSRAKSAAKAKKT